MSANTRMMRRLTELLVWATVFVIPWEEAIVVEGVGGLARIIAYSALITAVASIIAAERFRVLHPFHVGSILFVGWNFMSLAWTVDSDASVARALTYARLAGIVWMIWEFSQGREQLKGLIQAYICGCYASVASMVLLIARGEGIEGIEAGEAERFSGGGLNANDFALVLAMGIPMAFYLVSVGYPRWKPLRLGNWLFIPVAGAAILQTGSRGGLVSLVVGLVCLLATAPARGFWQRISLTGLLIATATAGYRFLPEPTQVRLAETPTELQVGSMTNRRDIWAAGWEVAKRSPVAGAGVGAFMQAVGPIDGMLRVSHNSYLAVLVESGVVGLALFFLMIYFSLCAAISQSPRERSFWLSALSTWAVGASAANWEYRKPTWFLLGILVNAGANITAAAREREARPPVAGARVRTVQART